MSAIAGIVNLESEEDLASVVGAMRAIQYNRAPHGTGVAALEGAYLGHGTFRFTPPFDQVDEELIVIHDRKVAIVYDGILFNRVSLGKACGFSSADAAAEPDGKIVLHCYLRWGSDCAAHLDGIFAFAIWDWNRRVLFAARDRLGEKPFYYYDAPDREFVFASEIKALLRSGRISRELDYEAIYTYLYEKAFYADETPLRRVRALPPGHSLEWRNGTCTVVQYWDIPCVREKIKDANYALSKTRELLLHAIEERLAGVDNPCLLLSGGIDSSLLLGMLSTMPVREITTVICTSGAGDQQRAMARTLAEQFKTNHVEVKLDCKQLGSSLVDFVWHCSMPTVGSLMAYFCTKEAEKHNATVAFHGHMADNTFEAEWLPGIFMPIEKKLALLKAIPERMRIGIYGRGEKLLRRTLYHRPRGIARHLTPLYLYFRRKRGLSKWYSSGLMPEDISELFDTSISQKDWRYPADIYRELYRKSGSDKMDERSTYAAEKAGSGPCALLNYESVAAVHSMQMMAPYQDQQLIEFSRALPFDIKGKGGIGKYITRQLVAQFVSNECATQKKAAFALPYRKWFCTDLWPIIEETLSRRSIENRGIFQYDGISELCTRYRNGDPTIAWSDIYAPVILEIWMRLFYDPTPHELSRPDGAWAVDVIG